MVHHEASVKVCNLLYGQSTRGCLSVSLPACLLASRPAGQPAVESIPTVWCLLARGDQAPPPHPCRRWRRRRWPGAQTSLAAPCSASSRSQTLWMATGQRRCGPPGVGLGAGGLWLGCVTASGLLEGCMEAVHCLPVPVPASPALTTDQTTQATPLTWPVLALTPLPANPAGRVSGEPEQVGRGAAACGAAGGNLHRRQAPQRAVRAGGPAAGASRGAARRTLTVPLIRSGLCTSPP